MAHHIFELNCHALRMHDIDVALLRHFLVAGAERTGDRTVVESLGRWEWTGPGVWLNVDETVLRSKERIFQEAEKAIANFGTYISTEYVESNIPELAGSAGKSAELLVLALHKLQAHLEASA